MSLPRHRLGSPLGSSWAIGWRRLGLLAWLAAGLMASLPAGAATAPAENSAAPSVASLWLTRWARETTVACPAGKGSALTEALRRDDPEAAHFLGTVSAQLGQILVAHQGENATPDVAPLVNLLDHLLFEDLATGRKLFAELFGLVDSFQSFDPALVLEAQSQLSHLGQDIDVAGATPDQLQTGLEGFLFAGPRGTQTNAEMAHTEIAAIDGAVQGWLAANPRLAETAAAHCGVRLPVASPESLLSVQSRARDQLRALDLQAATVTGVESPGDFDPATRTLRGNTDSLAGLNLQLLDRCTDLNAKNPGQLSEVKRLIRIYREALEATDREALGATEGGFLPPRSMFVLSQIKGGARLSDLDEALVPVLGPGFAYAGICDQTPARNAMAAESEEIACTKDHSRVVMLGVSRDQLMPMATALSLCAEKLPVGSDERIFAARTLIGATLELQNNHWKMPKPVGSSALGSVSNEQIATLGDSSLALWRNVLQSSERDNQPSERERVFRGLVLGISGLSLDAPAADHAITPDSCQFDNLDYQSANLDTRLQCAKIWGLSLIQESIDVGLQQLKLKDQPLHLGDLGILNEIGETYSLSYFPAFSVGVYLLKDTVPADSEIFRTLYAHLEDPLYLNRDRVHLAPEARVILAAVDLKAGKALSPAEKLALRKWAELLSFSLQKPWDYVAPGGPDLLPTDPRFNPLAGLMADVAKAGVAKSFPFYAKLNQRITASTYFAASLSDRASEGTFRNPGKVYSGTPFRTVPPDTIYALGVAARALR